MGHFMKWAASVMRERRWRRNDAGQAVIEYALVVGLLSAVLVGLLLTATNSWMVAIIARATTAIG
jgi:Flp pilus assembly pilin Flp